MATLTGWFATAFCNAFSLLGGTISYESMDTTFLFSCIFEPNANLHHQFTVETQIRAAFIFAYTIKLQSCARICESNRVTDPDGITSRVSSDEGVVGLGVDPAIVDHELESVAHVSAIAAAVLAVAVNQLLLRERHEVASHDLVDPLHGC